MTRRLRYLLDAVHIYVLDGWTARHPQLTRRQALASLGVNVKQALVWRDHGHGQ